MAQMKYYDESTDTWLPVTSDNPLPTKGSGSGESNDVTVQNWPDTQAVKEAGTTLAGVATMDVSTTATALPTLTADFVYVQASQANEGPVLLGDGTTQAFEIMPGQTDTFPGGVYSGLQASIGTGTAKLNLIGVSYA